MLQVETINEIFWLSFFPLVFLADYLTKLENQKQNDIESMRAEKCCEEKNSFFFQSFTGSLIWFIYFLKSFIWALWLK